MCSWNTAEHGISHLRRYQHRHTNTQAPAHTGTPTHKRPHTLSLQKDPAEMGVGDDDLEQVFLLFVWTLANTLLYMYVYTCVCVCVCVCVYASPSAHMHVLLTYILYPYVHTCACLHTYVYSTHAHVHVCTTHAHVHVCTNTYIHACVRMHTHIHMTPMYFFWGRVFFLIYKIGNFCKYPNIDNSLGAFFVFIYIIFAIFALLLTPGVCPLLFERYGA